MPPLPQQITQPIPQATVGGAPQQAPAVAQVQQGLNSPEVQNLDKINADPVVGMLRPLQIAPEMKAKIYGEYQGAQDEKDFIKRFQALDAPPEIKANLYRLRFAPPISDAQGAQQAIAQAEQQDYKPQWQDQAPSMWDILKTGFTAPGTMFGPPSQEERQQAQATKQLMASGPEHLGEQYAQLQAQPGKFTGASEQLSIPDTPFFSPQAAGLVQPGTIKGGAIEGAAGLASPAGIAQLVTLPESRLINLLYTGQLTGDTYQQVMQAKQLSSQGDQGGAREALGRAGVTGSMALLTAMGLRPRGTAAEPTRPGMREQTPPGMTQKATPIEGQVAPRQASNIAGREAPPSPMGGQTGAKGAMGYTGPERRVSQPMEIPKSLERRLAPKGALQTPVYEDVRKAHAERTSPQAVAADAAARRAQEAQRPAPQPSPRPVSPQENLRAATEAPTAPKPSPEPVRSATQPSAAPSQPRQAEPLRRAPEPTPAAQPVVGKRGQQRTIEQAREIVAKGEPVMPKREPRLSSEQLTAYRQKQGEHAKARDEYLAAKAQVARADAPAQATAPPTEHPVQKALTRFLKTPGRTDEFTNALRNVPEGEREGLSADLGKRADRAEATVKHVREMQGSADMDKYIREQLHEGTMSGKRFEAPKLDPGEKFQLGRGVPKPAFVREHPQELAEFWNLVRGRTMKEVRGRDEAGHLMKDFTTKFPEVKERVKQARADLKKVFEEIRDQGGRYTEEQQNRATEALTLITASTGKKQIAGKLGGVTEGPAGEPRAQGTAQTQAWFNAVMDRPRTSHFSKPTPEEFGKRIEYLEKEAKAARTASDYLKGEKEAPKAQPEAPKAPAKAPREPVEPQSAEPKAPVAKAAPEAPKTPQKAKYVEPPPPEPAYKRADLADLGADDLIDLFRASSVRNEIPTELFKATEAVHKRAEGNPRRDELARDLLKQIRESGKITPQQAAARYGKALQGLMAERPKLTTEQEATRRELLDLKAQNVPGTEGALSGHELAEVNRMLATIEGRPSKPAELPESSAARQEILDNMRQKIDAMERSGKYPKYLEKLRSEYETLSGKELPASASDVLQLERLTKPKEPPTKRLLTPAAKEGPIEIKGEEKTAPSSALRDELLEKEMDVPKLHEKLNPTALNAIAKPILDGLNKGDLTHLDASKRYSRALDIYAEGARAYKADRSKPPDFLAKAVEYAKTGKITSPKAGERGALGSPKPRKGFQAAMQQRAQAVKGPTLMDRLRETSDYFKKARMLEEALQKLPFQRQADLIRQEQGRRELGKFSTAKEQREMYVSSEPHGQGFTARQQVIYDHFIRDWVDQADQDFQWLKKSNVPGAENYVRRIAVRKNTMWDRIARGKGQYTLGSALKKTASALQNRSYFELEHPEFAKSRIAHVDDKGNVTIWDNKNGSPAGFTRKELEGAGVKFKTASSSDITKHTGQEYVQHLYLAASTNAIELRSARRATELLDAYKSSQEFRDVSIKAKPGDPLPDGFRTVQVPQLAGYAFEKHTADVLDRYWKELNHNDGNSLEKLNYGLTTTIYLNPVKHGKNIFDHWMTYHGLSTFLKPSQYGPMLRAQRRAFNAVWHGNNDYLYALDMGVPLRGKTLSNSQVTRMLTNELGAGLKTAAGKAAAKAWGLHPLEMYRKIMDVQRKGLFSFDDMLRLQAVYHHAEITGDSFQKSFKEVSKHLPDYLTPTHVGLRIPGTDIDIPTSTLAKGFRSKALIFGNYHYGRLKSYGDMEQDLFSKSTPKAERSRVADRLLMIAVSTILYSTLYKKLAEKIAGDKRAEMSPSGATTIPWQIIRVIQGKTSIARALSSTFTPSPLIDYAGRMLYGEGSRPKPVGKQMKEAAKGLWQEVGPVREAKQSGYDWRETARRALLNVYKPKPKGGSVTSLPGMRLPPLPRR